MVCFNGGHDHHYTIEWKYRRKKKLYICMPDDQWSYFVPLSTLVYCSPSSSSSMSSVVSFLFFLMTALTITITTTKKSWFFLFTHIHTHTRNKQKKLTKMLRHDFWLVHICLRFWNKTMFKQIKATHLICS